MILVVFVIMTGFGIVAPTLPLYARSFGVGYDAVGLLVSSFAFTRLLFDLVGGAIIDRFGERKSAATGIVVVGISSVLTGLAPTFPLAVGFRAAGGGGSAVLFAALYSYLLKVVPKERMGRTLSVFYGSFNVGIVAGGPIGGLIAQAFGLASPLFVYGGVLFVAGWLYLRFVHDPEPARSGTVENPVSENRGGVLHGARSQIAGLVSNRSFLVVIFANFAYLWMVAAVYDTLVPLFGSEGLGMSTVAIGAVFAVALAGEFAVLYHAGSLADRLGRKKVLVPAMAGLALATVILGWAGTVLWYAVLIAVLGVASGYAGVPPGAMLSDIVPDRGTGSAVGLFRFAGDLGFLVGPLVAGLATEGLGFRGAFAVVAVPSLVCALLLTRTRETLRPVTPPMPGKPWRKRVSSPTQERAT